MTSFPYLRSKRPAIPGLAVTLHSPDGAVMIPGVPAYLDTAADRTVVPLRLLHQLGVTPVMQAVVRGLGEKPATLDIYSVDVEIPRVAVISVKVIGHPDEPTVLIGRNILNLFRVTFDGPNLTAEFH